MAEDAVVKELTPKTEKEKALSYLLELHQVYQKGIPKDIPFFSPQIAEIYENFPDMLKNGDIKVALFRHQGDKDFVSVIKLRDDVMPKYTATIEKRDLESADLSTLSKEEVELRLRSLSKIFLEIVKQKTPQPPGPSFDAASPK